MFLSQSTFNSLYEIRLQLKPWTVSHRLWLSILFMRFEKVVALQKVQELNFQFSLWDSFHILQHQPKGMLYLSILFMRFRINQIIKKLEKGKTFNSLYEIPRSFAVANGTAFLPPFQFSLWDSGTWNDNDPIKVGTLSILFMRFLKIQML